MERLFRKHFWAVHLLFIFLVALLVARTVNTFVELSISPMPQGQPKRQQRLATRVEPPAQLDPERVSKLTGLELPKEPEVKEPEPEAEDMNSPPVRTSLPLRLLGTLLSADPNWSIASIQDTSSQRTITSMVSDEILGAEVLEIERERVIIRNNRRREFIDGSAGGGAVATTPAITPPTPQVAAAPVNTGGGKGLGAGIRALSANEYEVPRSEIERTLSNLNDVAMQARIVPSFKDGKAQGFKLFSIRPDSIYSKIGVQNGDVIRRINGFDLNSPEKALEIYSKLKEANRIDIEIERNGSVLRNTYNVR